MAKDISVTLDLPEDLLRALGHGARCAGCRPSDYLLRALTAYLAATADHPATSVRQALDLAHDWLDLQSRLRACGHVLRRGGNAGLVLNSWPLERALMPLAALGYRPEDLVLRFGAAFPADLPASRRQLSKVIGHRLSRRAA